MQIKPYFLQLGLGRVNYTLSTSNYNNNSDIIELYSGIITDFTPNSDNVAPTPLNYLSYETMYQLKNYSTNNNNNNNSQPLLTSSTTTNNVSDPTTSISTITGSSTSYNYSNINDGNILNLLKNPVYLSYPTIITCYTLSNFTNYYIYEDGLGFTPPDVSSNSVLAFSPTLTTAPNSSSFMDFISYLNNILNTSTLLTWNNLGLSSLGIILEDSPNGELEIGIYIPIQPTFTPNIIGSKIEIQTGYANLDNSNSNNYLINPYETNQEPGNGVLGLYNDSVSSNTNIYTISNSLYLTNTWNGFEKAIIKHVIDLYSPEI